MPSRHRYYIDMGAAAALQRRAHSLAACRVALAGHDACRHSAGRLALLPDRCKQELSPHVCIVFGIRVYQFPHYCHDFRFRRAATRSDAAIGSPAFLATGTPAAPRSPTYIAVVTAAFGRFDRDDTHDWH